MLVNALTMEEINTPPNSVFQVRVTCKTLDTNGKEHMTCGIISTSSKVQIVLKDAIAVAYGRSFSYRPALCKKVKESNSGSSSTFRRENMDPDRDGSDDDDIKIDNDSDSSSNSEEQNFVVTNFVSNEKIL